MRYLYLFFLFLSHHHWAQKSAFQKDSLYNRWSFEVLAGQNKAVRPFSEGYYSANPNNYFNFSGVNHFDAGVRYMFSDRFGLKLSGGYDVFTDDGSSGSLPFETKAYNLSLQGVVNLARILRFETFTKRIGLLAHGGVQVAKMYADNPVTGSLNEDNGGFILGLTPQFRITKWLALTGDFSAVSNVRQHLNWDGSYSAKSNNLTGLFYHTSLGLNFYFGNKEAHADWYVSAQNISNVDDEARKRLDEIETLMNDTDKDGVPDYLDQENNTPAGVAVDTRGKYIDLNRNGVPDELEREKSNIRIDQNYISGEGGNSNYASSQEVLAALIEKGYLSIYFNINKDTPNSGSTHNVMLIYKYLLQHPEAKIKLVGYADLRGDEAANVDLSQRRAQKLKNF
ncbi:hypothetical protein CHU92_04580 [Flavobacterium cyanobacteriorum]|uniref:OmpA-like domain-containing protein n=1 Tax=Flavobacterium cyanobacteriorum TaxID=2022802 RepID=A0A255ZE17_9FLAO|nr:OmpA family protein [Flavobacterium cyanobacteriorum]OYQ39651.1 hypothetical protein CHU92_04580 [Flavobacterium cyanobacteriorum]